MPEDRSKPRAKPPERTPAQRDLFDAAAKNLPIPLAEGKSYHLLHLAGVTDREIHDELVRVYLKDPPCAESIRERRVRYRFLGDDWPADVSIRSLRLLERVARRHEDLVGTHDLDDEQAGRVGARMLDVLAKLREAKWTPDRLDLALSNQLAELERNLKLPSKGQATNEDQTSVVAAQGPTAGLTTSAPPESAAGAPQLQAPSDSPAAFVPAPVVTTRSPALDLVAVVVQAAAITAAEDRSELAERLGDAMHELLRSVPREQDQEALLRTFSNHARGVIEDDGLAGLFQ